MPQADGFETGYFCWAELATTDQAGAKDFYTRLFGWDTEDNPITGGTYTTFLIGGRQVAAAFTQQEEERTQGIPPHWNQYVSVDDADSFAKKAEAAGGTVLAQPFDVMEFGRMAVIADPAGATLGLWQSMSHRGYGLTHEPGAVDWDELMTLDVDAARAFYGELFGWTSKGYDMPDGSTYTVFRLGDESVAGGLRNPQGMEEVPSQWTLYFNTADCDATAARVKELGGQILYEPQFVETVGKFTTCIDPQGAAFALLEPDPNAPNE